MPNRNNNQQDDGGNTDWFTGYAQPMGDVELSAEASQVFLEALKLEGFDMDTVEITYPK